MAVAVAGKGRTSLVVGAVRAMRRLLGRVFGEGRWAALILLLGLMALRVWDPVPVETMRVKVYDVYQQLKPRPAPEPMVYVADIDEASLAELGQWPWSRLVVGQLLLQLAQAGAFVGGSRPATTSGDAGRTITGPPPSCARSRAAWSRRRCGQVLTVPQLAPSQASAPKRA